MKIKTRHKTIAARVTKQEFDIINAASKNIGERTSQFIRRAVMNRIAEHQPGQIVNKNA